MAHIPEAVLQKQPALPGLPPPRRGKVRDRYELPDHPDLLLFVASDRISVFDFVLNALIDKKGQVLTAMNHFMGKKLNAEGIETDVVAVGFAIDKYLPVELRGNAELQKRASVVRKFDGPEYEDIVRICLTGSGWKSYQKTGQAFEYPLPNDLVEGCLLPEPLYTPTTKAAVGHDKSVPASLVAEKYGPGRRELALKATRICSDFAKSRGIIMPDTKFEITVHDGRLVILDEIATPDSSRYWDNDDYEKCMAKKKLPASLDKQFVRNYAKKAKIDMDETGREREPENPDDIAYVDGQLIPLDIINITTKLYLYIFWRMTGMKLERYQREVMGIDVEDRKLTIKVLIGSKSDEEQLATGLNKLNGRATGDVCVVSCHRNPESLREFASSVLQQADVIIAGAGMAAALPGVVKGWLCHFGRPEIPVIGVGFRGGNQVLDDAARLSIECLPESPVELDHNGEAYMGSSGFAEACEAALEDEFNVRTMTAKPTVVPLVSF